jgi:hypothetical protein
MNYIETHNDEAAPFMWTKTPEQIFEKISKDFS